jgi:hypothetical protein
MLGYDEAGHGQARTRQGRIRQPYGRADENRKQRGSRRSPLSVGRAR